MQYELSNLRKNNISVSKNQIFPIVGLYFFVLGTSLLGFSVYLFLESAGLIEQTLINWNGQGLFWSFITFFASLFVLFIPVEFFDKYFIENRSFRNLLTNVVSVIFVTICVPLHVVNFVHITYSFDTINDFLIYFRMNILVPITNYTWYFFTIIFAILSGFLAATLFRRS